ncbi:MAG: alpha-amylase family glycosyl hydrolase [bacterium]
MLKKFTALSIISQFALSPAAFSQGPALRLSVTPEEMAWQKGAAIFDGALPPVSGSAVSAGSVRKKAGGHKNHEYVSQLKTILASGLWRDSQPLIRHFVFRNSGNGMTSQAQSVGLEGFLFTKKELEGRFGTKAGLGQLDDYFNYLDCLLAEVSWTGPMRQELYLLRNSQLPAGEKNSRLNRLLEKHVSELQSALVEADASQWAKKARIYELFPRAYNTAGRRLADIHFHSAKRKRNLRFFADFRPEDFQVIKKMGFDTVWPMGIMPIGKRNQWGTAGGSPFSIRDYSGINPDLGTEADFKKFVAMAHQAGLRVIVDFVVNHTSMDCRLLEENPEYFISKWPDPWNVSQPKGHFAYQWKDKWLWVHHGGYEVFGQISTWDDTAQLDYSRQDLRRRMSEIVKSWVTRFDVDGFRVDMSYNVLNTVFARNWKKQMPSEEFLSGLIREVKAIKPSTAFIAEAYANQEDLAACGFDTIYSKYETSRPEGQTGWYDCSAGANALEQQSGINRAAFLAWQKGGAGAVNFIGNHDEKAPEKVYGARLPAALAMTMLLPGSIMVYSGAEIGFNAAQPWEEKPLPFSVPVQVDWNGGDQWVKSVYRDVFAVSNKVRAEMGEYEIKPLWPSNGEQWTGYVMESKTHPGMKKAVIANMTWQATQVNAAPIGGTFRGSLQPGEYKIINLGIR